MLDRTTLLGLAVAGLFLTAPATHCRAASPATADVHLATPHVDDEDKKDADDEKQEGKEKKEKKEIEQAVPLELVPQAVMDAVKKEVPGGTVTEAELVAKKGKIMYSFDVKAGDMAYDVEITVDGKFFSKTVDDEKDEKDEKEKKPAAGDKD